jgi:hypothetical protein
VTRRPGQVIIRTSTPDINSCQVQETLVSLIIGVCQQDPERWRQFDAIYAETLVYRRKAMLEATEPRMSENGIPRRGSDDLPAVWNGKVAKY